MLQTGFNEQEKLLIRAEEDASPPPKKKKKVLEMGRRFICLCGLSCFICRQEDEVEAPRGPCLLGDRRMKTGIFEVEGCSALT